MVPVLGLEAELLVLEEEDAVVFLVISKAVELVFQQPAAAAALLELLECRIL